MATLTDEQLADLREKAMAATPGEWHYKRRTQVVTDHDGGLVVDVGVGRIGLQLDADGTYIAAADPQTILALLQRIGELEQELATERAAVEVLAEIAERCQADSRGCEFCYVRGGCDPDNMAKCARAEARKRLGLGEEVQSGPD